MTDFKVGDKVKVREGHEKKGGTYPIKNELLPGEYTILSISNGGDFVSIDPDKQEFYASRFERVKPKLDGISEGDKVRVTTKNGLSGTFAVEFIGKNYVASKEWEADIQIDDIVSIEVVTKAKPPLPAEPGEGSIVVIDGLRPFVRTSKGWDIAGDGGMKGETWEQLLDFARFEKKFTLLYDSRSVRTRPKVVTW